MKKALGSPTIAFLLITATLPLLPLSSAKSQGENPSAAGNEISVPLSEFPILWKGLIAEAAGEGYEGMYAVACCVRNRYKARLNNGLVGLKRRDLETFVNSQRQEIRQNAKEIIRKVFILETLDTTNGATYFESVDFILNLRAWKKNKVILAHIGKHYFYVYKEK